MLALVGANGPVESPFASDDNPLRDISEDRVPGTLERPPGARTPCGATLPPHDLTSEQQPAPLEDLDDISCQRAVRPAPQVGDVDGDPAPRFDHSLAFAEHVAQEAQILEVGCRDAVAAEALLVILAGEIWRRGDNKGDRIGFDRVHVACIVAMDYVDIGRALDTHVVGDL